MVWAAAASPLGSPAALGNQDPIAIVAAPSPLTGLAGYAFHDFTGVLGDEITYYVMDVIGPGGTTRIPISSWQATLQTERSNYVQCVIPSVGPYAATVSAATEFVIYRQIRLGNSTFEYEMARAPIQTSTFDEGPYRYTCTLSGYSTGFAPDENPAAAYDRTLRNIRSISISQSGIRTRCAIDWLLRPSFRVAAKDLSYIVAYINYYVGNGDAYMDVGERA